MVKQYLDNIIVKEESVNNIRIIISKKETAKVNLERKDFPEDMSESSKAAFYRGAMELLSVASVEERSWWRSFMAQNPDIKVDVYLEIDTGRFYKLVEESEPTYEVVKDQ